MLRPIDQFIVEGFRDDPDSMAVVEQMLQRYFDRYLAFEMDRARSEVYQGQAQHLRDSTGVLSSLAAGSNPAIFDDQLTHEVITQTNKDLFKSPEDMVLFCKRQLRMNQGMREDMTLMTEAWRHSALIRIGQEHYDLLSKKIGEDLACAYMDYRLSELILHKMVKEQAPTSTVDYVVRKACEGSLFGIGQSLNKTPMQMRIDQEGEQMLAPTESAKTIARVLSVALDAPMTGALTCWGSLIGVGALEVGMELAQPVLISQVQGEKRQSTVEQILSRAMFLSDEDEFAKMRSQKLGYISQNNVVNTLRPKMHNKGELFYPDTYDYSQSSTFHEHFTSSDNKESVFIQSPFPSPRGTLGGNEESVFNRDLYSSDYVSDQKSSSFSTSSELAQAERSGSSEINPLSSNPPSQQNGASFVAQNDRNAPLKENSGKDSIKPKSYAGTVSTAKSQSTQTDGGNDQNLQNNSTTHNLTSNESTPSLSSSPQSPPSLLANQNASQNEPVSQTSTPQDQEMASQWAPLVGQFGIKDLKGIGANLGLVLATLPDMLFGMFSKKDSGEEFSWSKNLIPLASLLLGFKFNNPLLKMLLVGFGGVGLIKNGMDHISSKETQNQSLQQQYQSQRQIQFVPYPQQPLNPRIENLQINNNIMVMDIDKVPYSITLPETVAMAYHSKSLPLTTLANAVLQKYDIAVAYNNQNDLQHGMQTYNPQMNISVGEHEHVGLK